MGGTSADQTGPRPVRRPFGSLGLTSALLLAALSAACGCPPARADYTAPERTLESWQGSLCRDEPAAEYACLARSFQSDIGGFGNYHAWRRHMLATEPLVSALIKRADLVEEIVGHERSPDGEHAELVIAMLGQRLELSFDREVWVTLRWSDGRSESFRQPDTFLGLLHLTATGQWLQLARPEVPPEALPQLEALHFDTRWLLAGFRSAPPES